VVKIFGEEYQVKAEVATIGGLSAHAGQDFLVEYALRVKGRARQVFLSHGEPVPAEALTEKLVQAGMDKPFYPERGVSVEI
jgi:metallo-beta-lactamase family protein